MIPAAQVPVKAEDQHRFHAHVVGPPNLSDITRHLPRSGVALSAHPANAPQILLGRRRRNAFGKYAYHGVVLLGALVPAHDVVVQDGLNLPALLLRHLREVMAAVQSLLLTGDG